MNLDHKDVYVHLFVPQKRMILFGAGEDVIPLANLAVKTGFEVFVWDFRRSLLTEKRLPNVHFLEAWRNFQFRPTDSIIIMTHDFRKDQAILHALLERERVSYLGVMGPQRRTKRLLKAAVIPEFLHSPVGMDIGAEDLMKLPSASWQEVIKVQRRAMIEDNCNISGSREKQAFRDKG